MTNAFSFECVGEDSGTEARAGIVTTAHGSFETPVFMPVGTLGTVKGVTPEHLHAMGAGIILGNAYHLYLRPGMDVVKTLGGLHQMAAWSGSILTDSGGFQIYSLKDAVKVTEESVTFASHLDGSKHTLTPESVVGIQETLGSDIMMVLDQCPPATASRKEVSIATDRTHRWAQRCLDARTRHDNALFAIVQGGVDEALRQHSLETLCAMSFEGFALGGLSVGEESEKMYATVAYAAPQLPADKPRYLMGVGTPEDLLECVGSGIDMFDCVMPSRHARNGRLSTSRGELNIRNARFRFDSRPVDPGCGCYTCQNFSRAYLRHLIRAKEILYSTLATIHNLHYYLTLMRGAREAILRNEYDVYRRRILADREAGVSD